MIFLYDDLCMELACIMIYNNLAVILLILFLRWCLLLGGDFVEISIRTTWVTNFLLLFFSFTFFLFMMKGEQNTCFQIYKNVLLFSLPIKLFFFMMKGENDLICVMKICIYLGGACMHGEFLLNNFQIIF